MTARATDFMVWRVGNSVNWNCTAREIAEETGLSTVAVGVILRRNGWTAKAPSRAKNSFDNRPAVDFLVAGKFGHLE